MICVLASMRTFVAGTERPHCSFRRLALVAVALLMFEGFSLCIDNYLGICNKKPLENHLNVRKQVPVEVQCVGGCGATETRNFEWIGCEFCETTEWVEIVHKYATNIGGCTCKIKRLNRNGDIYFDMASVWKSNRNRKKKFNWKICCISQ
eukprot:jgi/Antlo1/189/924